MAKTVDEIVLKTTVEGQGSLDQLNARLASIDESSKKTATAMNQVQGGVRNVAYQVQDLAVQLSMGTNAFMALGQQLPQLLSGFGTAGVVIGAVAAVAIPALQAGLKAAGIDMRNLKEMTDDLAKANTAYLDAQKQNQPTLQAMANSYGTLTDEAKKFFDIREQLLRSKVERENIDAVRELRDEYKALSRESVASTRDQARFTPQAGAAAAEIGIWLRQIRKGVTEEQGYAIADMLKQIDEASPQKTVEAINNVLIYLNQIGPGAERFKQSFEKSVEPLLKINEELIKSQTNIRNATEEASAFNASLMLVQAPAQAQINAARRNYDQIAAIRREGALKATEFEMQLQRKENETGTKLDAERTAFRLKNQQEINDRIADFAKGQQETYYSQQLTNEAKQSQLIVEGKVLDLQRNQIDSIDYQSQLEERVLKNIFDQQQALANIEEMRRKNLITEERAQRLREQAGEIRKLSDTNAEKAVAKMAADNERSVRLQVEGVKNQNSERSRSLELEQMIFGMNSNQQAAARRLLEIENTRNRAMTDVNNNTRLSDKEKEDAKKRLNDEYDKSVGLAKKELEYNEKIAGSFGAGAKEKFKQIEESLSNFKVAGMAVDSVWNNMSSAIDRFVETGKFKFKDFALSVIMDLNKIALKSSVMSLFKTIGLGDLFSFKAAGGPVMGGTPYIVGEQGPELFVPNGGGNIVPNSSLGMGAASVTYNINAVDASSFKQLVASDPGFIYAVTEQGRKSLPATRR